MSLLDWWRQRGWQEIDGAAYQDAYAQFGGSVITHPQFIASVSSLVNIPLRYFGYFQDDKLVAAAPVWHSYIAGSKRILKRSRQYERVDLGNMEIILPVASHAQNITLRFRGNYFSPLHTNNISSLGRQSETLSLLKSYNDAEFSKKFQYNRTRELRLLEDIGCVIRDVGEFNPGDIAKWYIDLFEARWGKKPKAYRTIAGQLAVLKDFLTGKILFINDKPIAIQLVFFADSPKWTSFEFLNAGVDPEFHKYSPGGVLTFLNTKLASDYANAQEKELRYSFGRSDANYKSLWCHQISMYRI